MYFTAMSHIATTLQILLRLPKRSARFLPYLSSLSHPNYITRSATTASRFTEMTASLKIAGTVIDRDYSLLLIKKTDLPLETVDLLDQVQKHKPLSNEAVALLREQGLVEGRKNHLIIANVKLTCLNSFDASQNSGMVCKTNIQKSRNWEIHIIRQSRLMN